MAFRQPSAATRCPTSIVQASRHEVELSDDCIVVSCDFASKTCLSAQRDPKCVLMGIRTVPAECPKEIAILIINFHPNPISSLYYVYFSETTTSLYVPILLSTSASRRCKLGNDKAAIRLYLLALLLYFLASRLQLVLDRILQPNLL